MNFFFGGLTSAVSGTSVFPPTIVTRLVPVFVVWGRILQFTAGIVPGATITELDDGCIYVIRSR